VTFIVQINGQPAKITPHDLKAPPAGAKVPAGAGADLDEDDLFDLGDADLDLDDPITALNNMSDDEDDDEPRQPPPARKSP
jgi:hypothetical protein